MVYRTIWQNLKAWSDHEQEPATFAPLAIVFPQDIQFFLFCSSRHQSGVIHHIKHDTWQSINPQGQMCDVHSHQGIYLQAGWTGTSKEWLETAFFYFPKFRVGNIQGKGIFWLKHAARWVKTQMVVNAEWPCKARNSWVVTILGSREKLLLSAKPMMSTLFNKPLGCIKYN